jgi:archaellum component FlaC
MAIKIGKGIGKLLEVAGLAHEVPDETEQQAAEDAATGAENAGQGEAAVETNAGSAASEKGTGARAKIPAVKPAAVNSKMAESLKAALDQAPFSDVYRRFKEHGDALTGFIENEGKRILAVAKAAKITKAEISSAISARLKTLDSATENMRTEALSVIKQKLGKGESELKQVKASITEKEQELGDLRSQADTLNIQITALRQKVDEVQQKIQSVYEQARSEIAAEQDLVKKYLK